MSGVESIRAVHQVAGQHRFHKRESVGAGKEWEAGLDQGVKGSATDDSPGVAVI